MLFDMTDGSLRTVERTSFAAEQILERKHLQAAIRDKIMILGGDLLVVAEEFGEFEDARRRIDLLCVDRQARLVVIELKRTDEGGHMELQALRYAAMVSAMTFDDLVATYHRHLGRTGELTVDADTVRSRLVDWLETAEAGEPVLGREVRIILASADFSQEITTSVLWLNDVYGMDIRCIRMSLYRLADRLLLDVQQVIPLPEAEELTIRLRRRETVARAAAKSGADWTAYVINSPQGSTPPLRKRRAILAMVHAVHRSGTPCSEIVEAIPGPRFLSVNGTLDGDDLTAAFVETYPRASGNEGRWFLDSPLHDAGQTWVLSKMWGLETEATLASLVELARSDGYSFDAA
jgi:hypothetical protein